MNTALFDSFAKVIGSASIDVGLAEPEQVQNALMLQARGLILARRHPSEPIGEWTPLKATIEQMHEAEQVPESEFRQTLAELAQREKIPNPATIPPLPRNAPYLKDCLQEVGLNLTPYLNPMLAAQGAARTVKSITEIAANNRSVAEVLARTPRLKQDNSEPGYVRTAQSLNHLTDILTASIRENPSLAENPAVQKALTSAEMLAAQTFKRAAEAMEKTPAKGPGVALKMSAARAGLRSEFGLFSKTLSTSTHLAQLEKALEIAAQSSPRNGQAIRNAVQNYGHHIGELKVFGSLVPLWVDRVRPQVSGQGLSR